MQNKLSLFVAGLMVMTALVAVTPSLAIADVLNRQLELTMTGNDVSALQTFLAKDVSLYPQGLVTGYFGFLTKAAVSNFQSRNGLPPVGRVGPQTLPVLNSQMANGVGDVSAPTILSVNPSVTNTTAIINWTTDSSARGKVYYSTSPIRLTNTFDATGFNSGEPIVSGNVIQSDGQYRTLQSAYISNLAPNTTYYYLAIALDASNNVSHTLPSYFVTR